jgi:methionyl aminopeptidase
MKPIIKSKDELDSMREGGKMLSHVLNFLIKTTQVGMTTKDIAKTASSEINKLGGEPAFLNYSGFPDVICISINCEVVHGLPNKYLIKDGDMVSFDFGVKFKGMVTDAARTMVVGQTTKQKQKIIETTKLALDNGISAVIDGAYIGDISSAVQKTLETKGFGVVRDLVGHGVGKNVHEPPNIPNFGKPKTGQILKAGMTLAIEPMSTMGSFAVYTAPDGWAVITKDGSLSAHFEDTVLVTNNGSEILTR